MMEPRRADWELPPGVDRGLWDYVSDAGVARTYDTALSGSSLFAVDVPFVERHCPVNGRMIDLGCGTGRLLVSLAKRGTWVLGVDLSSKMLAVSRDRAATEGVSIHLLQANITRLNALADQSFDTAACLFSTLGMVRGEAERRRVVTHAYRLLKPGGRFVLHVHNRWFNLWNSEGRRWVVRNTFGAMLGRAMAGDRLMPVHQGIANLTLHLFTRREVCRLLRGVGFRVIEVKPISLRADGELRCPWWFGRLRAYGYLIAAERPGPP
jgi:ubiquinone/menaquinone biosynthesis C-methylase UbiE